MRSDLPISPKKKFKYSITFQSWDEQDLEAGDTDKKGFEVIDTIDNIGDILYEANTTYGIYYPLSFGGWESTEPEEDRDFWEKGIRKYYALHITNEDGTEISQEENDFITYLLSDGRYEIDKFRDYAVGGIVLGSIVLGVGALITYFYFKGKKPKKASQKSNVKSVSKSIKEKKSAPNGNAKSVTHKINGKKRNFPIKDAWRREHNLENKSQNYEVPQADRFEMGGDASEHYHEIEYGEGGVARAKEVITNKIGFNENIADYLVSKSEKFAIWLADSILKDEIAEREEKKSDVLKFLNERSNSVNTNYISNNYGGAIREILDWLQHPITPKQDLRNLTFDKAIEKAREWHNELQVLGGDIDFTEPEKNIILKKYPKNSDGIEYYWVFIPSNYCDLESSRMGHCGRTGYGNNLISLRSVKPYGKGHTINDSHITIAYGVNDGFFYQVKGKKNNKPAEKYFPYVFDLIKTFISDDDTSLNSVSDVVFDFSGFGSEYAQSEDYGFEDMTTEEIKELYDLKPSLFEDAEGYLMLLEKGIISTDELKVIVEENPETFESPKNQLRLYNAGIVDSKPSFVFELSAGCDNVADLVDVRGYGDDLVEKILCGDFDELYDGWSYYYENPSDLVDNLNKENEQRVIDEIVRITGLDELVVKENGIEHYLNGDDEDFSADDFDNIIRVLASAQNNADNSDYYNYLYKQLESSLQELGEVHSLNDEGVKMTIDLTNFNLSEEELVDLMEEYEFSDISDLFYELKARGDIDLPSFNIDDRYSPYGSNEDFNSYVSDTDLEQGYEKGGSLRPKNIKNNTKNKIKNMKPSKKYGNGGNLGFSKEDYFLVVKNWVYFTFNYPHDFVKDAFNSNHLEEKFSSLYKKYGSVSVLMSFWANLDNTNRDILAIWIKNNYFNSQSDKEKLLSVSDSDYSSILKHWNLFCFNYPYNFVESVFNDNHYEMKFTRAYERAGSVGAVNKFFTELSSNNQELFTNWVYDNYMPNKYAGGGELSELKMKLKELDSDGNTSVNYDDDNDEWFWEDYSNDSYRGGFESELEAYNDLINYLDNSYADGGEAGDDDDDNEKEYEDYWQDELNDLVMDFNQSEYNAFCYEHDIDEDDAQEMSDFIYSQTDNRAKEIIQEIQDGYYSDGGDEDDEEEYAGGGRVTKFVRVFFVQGAYGQGWEDLTAHDDMREAKKEKRVYDENESYPHRVIERRVLRSDYEKGNYAKGGEAKKYARGGMFGEGARLEYVTDAYASDEMQTKLKNKLGIKTDALGDNYVISFAYTDYGGDFLDKVAIAYFSENYPNNIIKENAGYNGENAYVFGEPAKDWIEQTEDYPLGFDDIESFYYEKQSEQESEDFSYFLDELVDDYSFDRESVMDWLQENKGGYYGMTTQGLDFSYEDLTEELLNEGLIEKVNEDDEEEYAGGGEIEDWMEEALESLMEETGSTDLEISYVSNDGKEFIATDNKLEYRVFKTEDDAEQTAIEQVREDLEENTEYFNQDWLMNYIDGRDFFEEALFEMNDSYVQDIESESDSKYANRLIAELVENGLMDEEDAESDNAEELADELKYDYTRLLTDEKLDEGNNGLDYFISNFGEEETYKMVRDNNLIDIDEASKDAVNVDGIGHFLSSYDGETLYLSNDYVAYRIN